jgi:hypothetical protein
VTNSCSRVDRTVLLQRRKGFGGAWIACLVAGRLSWEGFRGERDGVMGGTYVVDESGGVGGGGAGIVDVVGVEACEG